MTTPIRIRDGLTLIEVIATVAILAVLSAVAVLGVEASSRTGGDAKRIDQAAFVLEKLRDGLVRYNLGDRGDTSFTWRISGLGNKRGGINPGRLSQLTNQITSTSKNSCGQAYGATPPLSWLRNFFTQPIATGGTFKIADGFIANDSLVRYNAAGSPFVIAGADVLTPGTLAIEIPNVALRDAQALAARMEGDQSGGAFSVVRFTPSGNAPVTVSYHMAIHGC